MKSHCKKKSIHLKVVEVVPKLKLSEYAQRIRPRKMKGKTDTQEDFMFQLFKHAGMRESTVMTTSFATWKTLYTGRRRFSKDMKKDTKPIKREKLVGFFRVYIDRSIIRAVMSRFGVPEITTKKDDLFYDALCTQLEYLVEVKEESTEDMVATEYIRLLKEVDPQSIEDTTVPLLMDLDKLGLVIGKIRDLAKLLEEFDFEQSDSPFHELFASIVDICKDMPTIEIEHKATNRVVQEFYNQQDSFMQFLSRITDFTDYREYSHDEYAPSTAKDAIYTINIERSMRRSLYSAVNNIIRAENTLKEEIVLLIGHVPLLDDYLERIKNATISRKRLETHDEDKPV